MNFDDVLVSVKRALGISTNGKTISDYKEIIRLKEMLEQEEIPFEFRNLNGGYQLCYPCINQRICSVVEHGFSYGAEDDKLEIMGLLTDEELEQDEVRGYLSAENVANRIRTHFNSYKESFKA